jgi:hypothetical protein
VVKALIHLTSCCSNLSSSGALLINPGDIGGEGGLVNGMAGMRTDIDLAGEPIIDNMRHALYLFVIFFICARVLVRESYPPALRNSVVQLW